MKKHIGNLEITEKNQNDFKDLVEVSGYLYVYGSANLEALTTIGGNLYVYGTAKFEALTTVGGNLHVTGSAKLEALTTIGGYLYVYGSANLEALTTIGGNLDVSGTANLEAPLLTTIGGNLDVSGSANLEALTTIGGNLYVDGSAKLEAPLVKSNVKSAKETCKIALEVSFSLHGLIRIDSILSWLISEKTIGNVTVFEIKIVGKLNNSYAVKRGEIYSHGETVEKAIEDLRYKISSRDTSEFKNWKVSIKRTSDECIKAYRVITGACEQGVKDFCKTIDLEKKYTLKEIFKLTDDKFGHKEFVGFFEEKQK